MDHFRVHYSSGLFADFRGRTDKAFFEFVALQLAGGVATAEAMDAYKRVAYLQLFDNVPLVPGVQSFLRAARKSFGKLGLATSATLRDFGLAERKYQLAQWFDVIVTGDDTPGHKPDPEPYLRTLAVLNLAGPNTLVVEDSPNGIRSAKLAHCWIAALTTAFQVQELHRAGADIVVGTFAELGRELGIVPLE